MLNAKAYLKQRGKSKVSSVSVRHVRQLDVLSQNVTEGTAQHVPPSSLGIALHLISRRLFWCYSQLSREITGNLRVLDSVHVLINGSTKYEPLDLNAAPNNAL